jgi:Integral membrane protein DUF92
LEYNIIYHGTVQRIRFGFRHTHLLIDGNTFDQTKVSDAAGRRGGMGHGRTHGRRRSARTDPLLFLPGRIRGDQAQDAFEMQTGGRRQSSRNATGCNASALHQFVGVSSDGLRGDDVGTGRTDAIVVAVHALCRGRIGTPRHGPRRYTLASELGVVYAQRPPGSNLNPTTTVPIGTNCGITVAGCAISVIGGAMVGGFTVFVDIFSGNVYFQSAPAIVFFGAVTGLVGSLLDQVTYVDPVTGKVVNRQRRGPTFTRH